MSDNDATARWSRALDEVITPLIPRDRPVALVDFPRSINCGDHAIWLGEKAFLAAHGIEVGYQCDAFTYDRAAMASRIGEGAILMHGGGNFGDIYSLYSEFRFRVLEDFPRNKVIVLPQQTAFLRNGYLNRTRALLARHPDVTLISRCAMTHHFMSEHFGDSARVIMAPDMAFALGPLPRPRAPAFDVVWIARADGEKAHDSAPESVAGLVGAPAFALRLEGYADGLDLRYKMKHRPGEVLITDWNALDWSDADRQAWERLDFDAQSEVHVARAKSLLSLGRIVITDRLHGHILCLLLGIPHVLLNNNLGKTWNFHDTWTRGSPLCRIAQTPAEAWNIVQRALVLPGARSGAITGWSQDLPPLDTEGLTLNWTLCEG